MRQRVAVLVAAGAFAAAAACGSPQPAASAHRSAPTTVSAPAPARDPSKDTLPLLADVHVGASPHIFQGGDDHVTLAIDNRGRDIQDLVITAGPWLQEHGLAMGTTRTCNPDLDQGLIACGPIYSGQSANAILRALPAHAGTFEYEIRLYDRENGALHPIQGLDGQPVRATFTEVVDPL